MDEVKEFEKTDLTIIQNLVGKKLNDIFKQLDFFIINFGDEIEFSLHTYTLLRIRRGKEIIMTSSDEFFLPNHEQIPNKIYKKDEMHKQSLLNSTLHKTKELLKTAKISKIELSETADLLISFDNNVVIESFIDCQCQNYEFYRFFKYNKDQPHYVVKFLNQQLIVEKIYADLSLLKKPESKKLKKLKEKLEKKNTN